MAECIRQGLDGPYNVHTALKPLDIGVCWLHDVGYRRLLCQDLDELLIIHVQKVNIFILPALVYRRIPFPIRRYYMTIN
jgi:hypothetical protein